MMPRLSGRFTNKKTLCSLARNSKTFRKDCLDLRKVVLLSCLGNHWPNRQMLMLYRWGKVERWCCPDCVS